MGQKGPAVWGTSTQHRTSIHHLQLPDSSAESFHTGDSHGENRPPPPMKPQLNTQWHSRSVGRAQGRLPPARLRVDEFSRESISPERRRARELEEE
ncbi:hypothetical protein AOLI_G00014630 [Acnodon oligacanthus]